MSLAPSMTIDEVSPPTVAHVAHLVPAADSTIEVMKIGTADIVIDHARDGRLSDQARDLLSKYYIRPGERFQHAYARAAAAWSTFHGVTDEGLAQRLYDYASKGWFGFASPVLSNAPLPGEKSKSLPISCFAGHIGDSLKELIGHSNEFRWLSVKGGGVGGHWSDVRSVSDVAPGPIPFIKTMDSDVSAYKQGKTRKGSYAAYLDISHPDIVEFTHLRVPTGDANRKCLSMGFHHAVNVTDAFMRAVANDEDWLLIDPHDGRICDTVSARELWESILEIRAKTGEPYINFIDTANRHLPEAQKKLGLTIKGSNLCNEIHLATGPDHLGNQRTFVCCLSSLNVEKRDEWLSVIEQFVSDLVTMLDNVLQFFIDNAGDDIAAARYSAQRERALGLGTMGVHSYLQRKNLAWESVEAIELDEQIHREIQEVAIRQSLRLGAERGEAPDMEGTGRRNSHVLAIAPTANNASIVGTSPGIEPWNANAFSHRSRAGTHLIRNPYLEKRLEDLGQNTDDVWQDIILSGGSVQHLDFLSEHDKAVFKTAKEINQMWVVRHAAARQKHICQGQSLNLFFMPGSERSYINRVHTAAWKLGCKGLYYYRTESRNKAEAVSRKIKREALVDYVAKPSAFQSPSDLAGIPRENVTWIPNHEDDDSKVSSGLPADGDDDDCVACQG